MTTLKSLKNEIAELRNELIAFKEAQKTLNRYYASEINRLSALLDEKDVLKKDEELTDEELIEKEKRDTRIRRYNQYIETLTMGPRPFSARRNDENG